MKAILVLDEMPNSCHACPLTYIDCEYGAYTTKCVIDKDTIPHYGKWDECPLKPLPLKGTMENVDECEYNRGFVDGRNHCIELIAGEIE